MGLIYRNGRPYYYKSVRKQGRVTSEYQGSGGTALLLSACDVVETDKGEAERREHEAIDDLEEALDELNERGVNAVHDALRSAGYHQHHRGEWRLRREH